MHISNDLMPPAGISFGFFKDLALKFSAFIVGDGVTCV